MLSALIFCCIVLFNPVSCVRQQPPASTPTSVSSPAPTPLSQPSTAVSDPKIRSICEDTSYPDLCLSSITPFYNGKTDLESVTGMLIKSLTQLTEKAVTTLTKMSADPMYSHDRKMAEGIKICREKYYVETLYYLKYAMDLLLVEDFDTLSDYVDSAAEDYDSCEDNLTGQPDDFSKADSPTSETISQTTDEQPKKNFPMAKIYEELSNLSEIISDVIMDIQLPD